MINIDPQKAKLIEEINNNHYHITIIHDDKTGVDDIDCSNDIDKAFMLFRLLQNTFYLNTNGVEFTLKNKDIPILSVRRN